MNSAIKKASTIPSWATFDLSVARKLQVGNSRLATSSERTLGGAYLSAPRWIGACQTLGGTSVYLTLRAPKMPFKTPKPSANVQVLVKDAPWKGDTFSIAQSALR